LEFIQNPKKFTRRKSLFGATSSTDDAKVMLRIFRILKISIGLISKKILPEFIGEIHQIPPQFSALKISGEAAHRIARRGETVKLKPRLVQISEIKF